MPNTLDKAKITRLKRVLAAISELTAAMADDFNIEYARYKKGEHSDDPEAFIHLAVMRDKMVHFGGDAEPLLGMVSMMDKEFADIQYAKLLTARDIVKLHDEHFQAEAAKVQAAQQKKAGE